MLSHRLVRPYILRGLSMRKVCVTIGYKRYVMEMEDAMQFTALLANSEVYEQVSRREAEGGITHHVYDIGLAEGFSMNLISGSLYQMAKLAGKPVKS